MSHDQLFRLFCYGSLKRGFWNHEPFCGTAISIEPATVRGRLYEFPSGIPVLEVPECDIIAHGSADIAGDMSLQQRLIADAPEYTESDHGIWRHICGELITLPTPVITVPPIDRLEGFHPDGASLYIRVLVPVKLSDERITAAWCYVSTSRTLQSARATDETMWP